MRDIVSYVYDMHRSSEKKYGVSDPLSLAGPTPEDLRHTAELVDVLRSYNLYESEEESRKREEVLAALSEIVREWSRDICLQQVGLLMACLLLGVLTCCDNDENTCHPSFSSTPILHIGHVRATSQ